MMQALRSEAVPGQKTEPCARQPLYIAQSDMRYLMLRIPCPWDIISHVPLRRQRVRQRDPVRSNRPSLTGFACGSTYTVKTSED